MEYVFIIYILFTKSFILLYNDQVERLRWYFITKYDFQNR